MSRASGPSLPTLDSIPGYAQAESLRRASRYTEAAGAFLNLWRANPRDWRLVHLAGHCALVAGFPAKALPLLKSSVMLNPGPNPARIDLGGALRAAENYAEARKVLEDAVRLNSADRRAVCALAELCLFIGDREAATRATRTLFENPPESLGLATSMLKLAKLIDQREQAIRWTQGHLAAHAQIPPRPRAEALFALANAHDAMGDHDDAFAEATEANALVRPPFDRDQAEQRFRQFMDAWSGDLLDSAPPAATTNDNLVFIVGMPRSGTSLVEQILAAHPKVIPGGERNAIPELAQSLTAEMQTAGLSPAEALSALTDQRRLDALSAKLAATVPPHARSSPVFTDKLPGNFQHLALIQLVAPGARIIALRRDPRDVAISNYMHLYAHDMPNTHDLEDIAWFQSSVDRAMDKWKQVLRIPILDVVYEDLVANLEGVSKRIIDFVGLEWDDACLKYYASDRIVNTASNEQVRRPVYSTSIGRWKNYERHMALFTPALARYSQPL